MPKKQCSRCMQSKGENYFYKNKAMPDGIDRYCKDCRIAVNKLYKKSEKGERATRRFWKSEKGRIASRRAAVKIQGTNIKKAHNAVATAVKSGKLPNVRTQKCAFCGKQAKNYHHHKGYDPAHWLDVLPCCVPCHRRAEGINP